MSQQIARWTYVSQVIVQRVTLVSILVLAVAGLAWSLAAAVGFADPYYFSRQFKRALGQYPREFLRRNRALQSDGDQAVATQIT